jgi:hypothetical protein
MGRIVGLDTVVKRKREIQNSKIVHIFAAVLWAGGREVL